MTAEIPLTKGFVAIVDDEDYEMVQGYKWHALVPASRRNVYAVRRIWTPGVGGGAIRLHRMIISAPTGVFVDHIDGNGLNCCRSNLRLCTMTQNNQNARVRSDNTSGHKGVVWHPASSKWRARISVNGKMKHIGIYVNIEDAVAAYRSAALNYYGEFSRF